KVAERTTYLTFRSCGQCFVTIGTESCLWHLVLHPHFARGDSYKDQADYVIPMSGKVNFDLTIVVRPGFLLSLGILLMKSYDPDDSLLFRKLIFVLPHSQRTDSGVSRSGDTRRYSPQSEQVNPPRRSRNALATGSKSLFTKLSQELKCTAAFTCHCSAFEASASSANLDSRAAKWTITSFWFHEFAASFARIWSFRMCVIAAGSNSPS